MRTVWCRTSILIDQYGCTIYLQLFDFGYGAVAELCTRGHKIPELQADVESKEPAEEMRVPFMALLKCVGLESNRSDKSLG